MPAAAAQDQWEDVSPAVAQAAPAQKKDDGWEDVTPQAAATPPAPPAAPGYFKRLGQSLHIPTSTEELKAAIPSTQDLMQTAALGPIKQVADMAADYGRTASRGIKEGYQDVKEAVQNVREGGPVGANVGKAASGVVHAGLQATPIVGPAIETYGEDVGNKNYAGAAGGATGIAAQILGPKLFESAPEAISAGRDAVQSVKDSVGNAVRTEGGALKPGVRAAARIAGGATGAAVGSTVGAPSGGAVVGGLAGPQIADAILPNRPALPGVAPTLPDAGEFYEQRGDDLMDRQKQQDALDRVAARKVTKPVDPVAEAVKNRTAAWIPTKVKAPEPKVSIVSSGETIRGPVSVGSEGSPARWTNEFVMDMAAKGNRDAIVQATRRGLRLPENARYLAGDQDFPRAVLNPREVTRFAPDGTPIRDLANPIKQNPSSRARIQIVGSDEGGGTPEGSPPNRSLELDFPPPQSPSSAPAPPQGVATVEPEPEPEMEPVLVGKEQPAKTPRIREPREQLAKFDADTMAEAKAEVDEANGRWQGFERPGRYVHNATEMSQGASQQRPDIVAYGIKSARGQMESAHPWLKNLPKMTPEKLRAAIESGKGVEYTRLLNEAGKHIEAVKAANTPIIEEMGAELDEAIKAAQSSDPELAQTLQDIRNGKYNSMRSLSQWAKEKINDTNTATPFDRALEELSREELSDGGTEPAEIGDQSRQATEGPQELGPPKKPRSGDIP